MFPPGGPDEQWLISRLAQVAGRIHFPGVVGLRSVSLPVAVQGSFSASRSCPQFLVDSPFKSSKAVQVTFMLGISLMFRPHLPYLLTLAKEMSTFKSTCDYMELIQRILDHLPLLNPLTLIISVKFPLPCNVTAHRFKGAVRGDLQGSIILLTTFYLYNIAAEKFQNAKGRNFMHVIPKTPFVFICKHKTCTHNCLVIWIINMLGKREWIE